MIMMLLIFSSISLSSAIHFYIYQACRLENFSSLSNIRLDPPFTDWPLEICILHATKRTETINELGKLLRSLPWISPSFALPSSPLQSLFLLSSYFRLLSLSLSRSLSDRFNVIKMNEDDQPGGRQAGNQRWSRAGQVIRLSLLNCQPSIRLKRALAPTLAIREARVPVFSADSSWYEWLCKCPSPSSG